MTNEPSSTCRTLFLLSEPVTALRGTVVGIDTLFSFHKQRRRETTVVWLAVNVTPATLTSTASATACGMRC